MSGIAGIFNLDGRPVDQVQVQRMMDRVSHRGPDEADSWVKGSVGLGHCQLRTTPESLNEHQPWSFAGGKYVIVCDGRVDNRQELIAALQAETAVTAPMGASTPDAELFLLSYIVWGDDCLRRIVGDFALVIWDETRRQLFCGRDPLGVRTLYYYQDDRRFIFASDLSAILTNPGIRQQLDQLKVGLILLGNVSEAEHTLFQGVHQVLPAQSLTVTRRGVTRQVFWEPEPWRTIKYSDTRDYVEHFQEVFFQAVGCHLRGAGPVGISLSGGMDSTSVASAAGFLMQNGRVPSVGFEAFSSVFQDFASVDESKYIQQILDTWGIQGHPINADGFWGFKPLRDQKIPWNHPYPVPFQARHENLLNIARDTGVRVILTGEGGDELFIPGLGYLLDLLRNLRLVRLREELGYLDAISRRRFWQEAFHHYKSGPWDLTPRWLKQLYRKLRPGEFDPWLGEDFIRSCGALEHPPMEVSRPRSRSIYRRSQYVGPLAISRAPYIPYITEMYARHHVEVRHPFLDRRLVEFLTRVPPEQKMARGWAKLLLRKAMEGFLPEEVRLRRSKSNFTDLTALGYRREETRLRGLLEGGFLARSGWVKKPEMQKLYDGALVGERGPMHHLIPLVNLEEWLHQHFASNGSGASEGPLYTPLVSSSITPKGR